MAVHSERKLFVLATVCVCGGGGYKNTLCASAATGTYARFRMCVCMYCVSIEAIGEKKGVDMQAVCFMGQISIELG